MQKTFIQGSWLSLLVILPDRTSRVVLESIQPELKGAHIGIHSSFSLGRLPLPNFIERSRGQSIGASTVAVWEVNSTQLRGANSYGGVLRLACTCDMVITHAPTLKALPTDTTKRAGTLSRDSMVEKEFEAELLCDLSTKVSITSKHKKPRNSHSPLHWFAVLVARDSWYVRPRVPPVC
ncbi:hypothetical protein F4778DRAFT_52903 [Xylariomycetidae sp. FL2044]|nr:hypothetical protein F4778DRAFT_52903 [Xylariomycetidae sp. FL2044]